LLLLILLGLNGCCTNGFEVGGNGWVGNIFVCCCCCGTGNFCDTPVDVWGTWENGALPNIELLKPDEDVWWPNSKKEHREFR
jgi:hypothetical protein